MKLYIYMIVLSFFLVSCGSSLHTGGAAVYPNTVLDITPINGKVILDKTKVLTGTSKTTVFLMIFRTGDDTFLESNFNGPASSKTKNAAMFNALENTGNDIMVNPKYIIKKTKSLFGLITTEIVQVTGYGGKIQITD